MDTAPKIQRPVDGPQLANVSTAIVQLHRKFYGRGPTRARTVLSGDILTCVLADVYTTVEETLVDRDYVDLVVGVRAAFQRAMRAEFIEVVEEATGRRVVSFSSGLDAENAVATETFVLEPNESDSERGTIASHGTDHGLRPGDAGTRQVIQDQARDTRREAQAVRAETRQAGVRGRLLRTGEPG